MTSLKIQIADTEHGDDEDRFVHVPAEWVICSKCRGSGGHLLRFGAITGQDREDNWDEDSWDAYMRGDYDEKCEDCDGTGKVLVIDRAACQASRNPEVRAAVEKYDRDAEIDAEIEAEHRAEMRYMYGPDY